MNVSVSPFARDGHLHELGLEAYVSGSLDADAMAQVDTHLATCPICQAMVADARADDRLPLPAWTPKAEVQTVPDAANRPWRAWMAPISVVAAALVAFLVMPTPSSDVVAPDDTDVMRSKGMVQLGVWADEGPSSRRIGDGQFAFADDRLGFELSTSKDGWFLVVGVDDDGQAWLGYPQDGSQRAVSVQATQQPEDLGAAVQLDGTLGSERIVGLLCDKPLSFGDVEARVVEVAASTEPGARMPELIDGCSQSEIRVRKKSK